MTSTEQQSFTQQQSFSASQSTACPSTVWLVEPDPVLRRLLVSHIDCRGFRVFAFPTALDAMGYAQFDPEVDALVTENELPGVSSETFLREFSRRYPHAVNLRMIDLPTAEPWTILKSTRLSDFMTHMDALLGAGLAIHRLHMASLPAPPTA